MLGEDIQAYKGNSGHARVGQIYSDSPERLHGGDV